eukprot:bmy_01589T0
MGLTSELPYPQVCQCPSLEQGLARPTGWRVETERQLPLCCQLGPVPGQWTHSPRFLRKHDHSRLSSQSPGGRPPCPGHLYVGKSVPVSLNSQQVETADDITGSQELAEELEPKETRAAGGYRHGGPGHQWQREAGEPGWRGPPAHAPWDFPNWGTLQVPPFLILSPTPPPHTAGTLVPQLRGWHSPLPTKQGLGKQESAGVYMEVEAWLGLTLSL